jgi:hypothetical protein
MKHLSAVHMGEISPTIRSPTLSGDQPSQSLLRSGAALNSELTMAAHLGRLQSPFSMTTSTDAPALRDLGGAFPPLRSDPSSDGANGSTSSIAGLRCYRYGMLSSPPVNQPISLGPSRLPPPPVFSMGRSESVSSPARSLLGFQTPSNGFPMTAASAVAPSLHVRPPTNGMISFRIWFLYNA